MARPRLAAAAALALVVAALALGLALAAVSFPRGLIGVALLALALWSAWMGARRRGPLRALGLGVGVVLVAGVVALLVVRSPLLVLSTVSALWLSLIAAREAFRPHVTLPPAPRPVRAVLFYNPRSGGGKAARFDLPREARERGIEPVELTAGTDLEELARTAVARGADALAMAGGDGSQAVVARVAAELGLPYACIPAGTRNHFARDLGVDRDDVVGALDALVDGGERLVDVAEVNGRTFVNNVSLGLYARAAQQDSYRDAKLRTVLDTVPAARGNGERPELRWRGADGREQEGAAAILVSNNRYRLGYALGSGTRPRLDEGVLGITVLGASRVEAQPGHRPWREWTARTFEVDAPGPVPAGIDGEAHVLEPPLQFRVLPRALRCRIAHRHPGASPSAFEPDGPWDAVRSLCAIAAGHNRTARGSTSG